MHLIHIRCNPVKQALVQQIPDSLIIATQSNKEVLIHWLTVDRNAPEEPLCRIVRQPFIKLIEQRGLHKFLLQFFYIKQHISYCHIIRSSSHKVYNIWTAPSLLVNKQLLFIGSVAKRGHIRNQPERLHYRQIREQYRQDIALIAVVASKQKIQPTCYHHPALAKIGSKRFKEVPDKFVLYHMRLFCRIKHILEIVKDDEVTRGVQRLW